MLGRLKGVHILAELPRVHTSVAHRASARRDVDVLRMSALADDFAHKPSLPQDLRVMTWDGKDYFKENRHHTIRPSICDECGSRLVYQSGCWLCPSCGWAAC
jgi:hypothetical protein